MSYRLGIFQMQGGKTGFCQNRDKCKPVLLGLSLAGNLAACDGLLGNLWSLAVSWNNHLFLAIWRSTVQTSAAAPCTVTSVDFRRDLNTQHCK
jgi:hypothetical protein